MLMDVQTDLRMLPVTSSAGHPIEAVLGLGRFVRYTDRYLSVLSSRLKTKVETVLEAHGLSLPGMTEFNQSLSGLFKLQSTYNLAPSSLLASTKTNMGSAECVTIANTARDKGFPYLASDWMKTVVATFHKKNDGLPGIVASLNCVSNDTGRSSATHLWYFNESKHTERENRSQEYAYFETNSFNELCRKHMHQSSLGLLKASSRCRYIPDTKMPIRRWKSETMSRNPHVVLYHDVISDTEADTLVRLGKRLLQRAVTGRSPGQGRHTEARISKVAWVWDNHTIVVRRLSQRVTAITGLKTGFRDWATFAEPFQVINYGVGGHYAPHYDFYVDPRNLKTSSAGSFTEGSGDRLATFMFYLSNLDTGGATVFPELGIGVPPVKVHVLPKNGFFVNTTEISMANKWIRQVSGAMTLTCPRTQGNS